MKSFFIAVIFLVIGALVGGYLSIGVGAGFGAASGLLAGSQVGVCMTVESAKQAGMINSEQADTLIRKNIATLKGKVDEELPASELEWVESEADCTAKMAELRQAQQQ